MSVSGSLGRYTCHHLDPCWECDSNNIFVDSFVVSFRVRGDVIRGDEGSLSSTSAIKTSCWSVKVLLQLLRY